MNLFDALKQYLSDAAPGGSLNPEVTPQGLLDVAAMASTPVPVVGDVLGLAADAKRLYDNPSERTAMNYGMSALGLLPFVPAGMTKLTNAADALRGPQAEALETARKNAVTMLGLPPNNTPMDRARALGFDTELFHGTKSDVPAFDVNKAGSNTGHASAEVPAVWASGSPKVANIFASKHAVDAYPVSMYGPRGGGLASIRTHGLSEGGNVMPLLMRTKPARTVKAGDAQKLIFGKKNADWRDSGGEFVEFFNQAPGLTKIKGHPMAELEFRANQYVIPDPSILRSRFAAFDPARINENDLLGRADPRLLGLMGVLGAGGIGGAYLYNQDKK